MDMQRIISLVFTTAFILILFYIILKALLLMARDMKRSGGLVEEEQPLVLEFLKTGENRNIRTGSRFKVRSEATFGRKNDNAVVLSDSYVSGYHARIFQREGRFVLEDRGSTNGTLLNGEKLTMKTYLKDKDIISIGTLTMRVNL